MVNKAGWGTTAPKSMEYPARFWFSPSAFLERRIYPRNTLSIANGSTWNIPCADFFYMRNGKIERFDCYPALNIMLKQMGVPPDFASAVKRSTQR